MQNEQIQVTVSVPATSANLGPGFDCLGLALALRNEVTMTAENLTPERPTPDREAVAIHVSGVDAAKIPTDAGNLLFQAARTVFHLAGRYPERLRIEQFNAIPVGSGLGSSSAALIGGMTAANALLGSPLRDEDILHMAARQEGHLDNVAPAMLGGLVVGVMASEDGERLHLKRLTLPPLRVVVVLPDFQLPTSRARAALPAGVSHRDAVFNVGRVGLLIQALTTADYDLLRVAMEDRLHQPYRLPIVPGAEAAMEAAYAAGAAGVALSGAGPSLIAFAADEHQAVGRAMADAFAAAGLSSRTWIAPVSAQGVQIVSAASTGGS